MLLNKVNSFIKHEVWRISLKDQTPVRAYLIRGLQVLLISIRGFNEDKVQLRASALTFYTLLSIVPVLAMAFGIAEAFGFAQWLNEEIQNMFQGQEEVLEYLLTFADRMFTNTNGSLMALIGFAMLLWSIMKVFGNIEYSFNDIWQIKQSRIFVRKFSDYLSLMLVAPLLMIISISASMLASITDIGGSEGILSYVGPVLSFFISLIPYTLIWIVLTLVYIIMPNTKVDIKSGLIAGIVAGITFQLFQLLYINSQGALSGYNRIYGSFAALPLFLIYMRISWLIVLFGAEISYAVQNVEDYEFEKDTLNLSEHRKKALLLYVAKVIIDGFSNGSQPFTSIELAKVTEIPIRLIREIVYMLLEAGVILEVKTANIKDSAYLPAQDINKISIGSVLEKIEIKGVDNLKFTDSDSLVKINKIMEANLLNLKENNNVLIKDI